MVRHFNITGLCIPELHYMVDLTERIVEIETMVDRGLYFVINRPRQYGKTTTLNLLAKKLQERYLVIRISFEGAGDKMFASEESFCSSIFTFFADGTQLVNPKVAEILRRYQREICDFPSLSRGITNFLQEVGQEVVLIIDEVDKSSNYPTFLTFLGLLRTKYLNRNAGTDLSFQSVILASVNDIRNLKLTIRDDREARVNSSWNIAAKFNLQMSFTSSEIATMLTDYAQENEIEFDVENISREIYKLTGGYPYLVSDICLIIDEYLRQDWTIRGVQKAAQQILREKNTLFDDVIKNIENNPDLKALVYEILVEGRTVNYNPDAYEQGLMYGIFTEKDGKLAIHNTLFEERIYNYLLEQSRIRDLMATADNDSGQFVEGNRLLTEKLLLNFQEFMHEEYREQDEKFYESEGRLVFLAFLKPILNGRGFSFVEPQTRQNRRMDVVIVFGNEKFVVELKVWRGKKYIEKGYAQLVEYLETQKLDEGYLVVFNTNKSLKLPQAQWKRVENKRIFEVLL